MKEEFQKIFISLKSMLSKYEKYLTVTIDKKDSYSLDAGYNEVFKRNMFFGAVQVKKNYISVYLMPVYVNPKLLDGISPELKKRMQGKSCFNFKEINKTLFKELSDLTKKGFEFYKKNGWC